MRTYQNVPTDFHGRDETELAADRGERFRGVAAFLSRVMTRVSIDMPGGAPSNLALEAVDLCDVRMIERGEDLGLTAEPTGALTCRPLEDRSGFRFTGQGTLWPLLEGVVPQNVASLRPASWNQIVSWLRQVDGVRRAA